MQQLTVTPKLAGVLAQAGQLSAWRAGGVYQALVTGTSDGKVEILIENRYFLATTALAFSEGDRLTLQLTKLSQDHLVFRLAALPPTADATTHDDYAQVLLKAVRAVDSPGNRVVLSLLIENGLEVSQSSLEDLSRLSARFSPEHWPAVVQLYRELQSRRLRPSWQVLEQMALRICSGSGNLAALIDRVRQRQRGQPADSADLNDDSHLAESLSGSGGLVGNETAPSAAELQATMQLLYSSPEAKLLVARQTVELHDLGNVLSEQEQSQSGNAELLAACLAQRVLHALGHADASYSLPVALGGELMELRLQHSELPAVDYQAQHLLRLNFETEEQGSVEIAMKLNGRKLKLSIHCENQAVLDAYADEVPFLGTQLASPPSPCAVAGIDCVLSALGSRAGRRGVDPQERMH